jgi:hypothetical protein
MLPMMRKGFLIERLHENRTLLFKERAIRLRPQQRGAKGSPEVMHPSCVMNEANIARMKGGVNGCGGARSQREHDRGYGELVAILPNP